MASSVSGQSSSASTTSLLSSPAVTVVLFLCLLLTGASLFFNMYSQSDTVETIQTDILSGAGSAEARRDLLLERLKLLEETIQSEASHINDSTALAELARLRAENAKLRQQLDGASAQASVTDQDTALAADNGGFAFVGASAGGEWVSTNDEEWTRLNDRIGCNNEQAKDNAACCHPDFFTNFTTPMRQLEFKGAVSFDAKKILEVFQGSNIAFIGDSVTAQVADGFRHALAADLPELGMHMLTPRHRPEHASVSTVLYNKADRSTVLQISVYRADKTNNVVELLEAAAPVQNGAQDANATEPTIAHLPLDLSDDASSHPMVIDLPTRCAVANIGLHFFRDLEDTARFTQQLRLISRYLHEFRKQQGHFAWLRDITPQHFKALPGNDELHGSYAGRDSKANYCAPWSGNEGKISFRLNMHNSILLATAAEFGLRVQTTAKYLADRHDAHLETRRDGVTLDCTHWCHSVFTVFDDTFMETLEMELQDAGSTGTDSAA